MIESFLRTFQARCPACRAGGQSPGELACSRIFEECEGRVLSGLLQCAQPACQAEFPVIDGIPLLLPDARGFVAGNLPYLTQRHHIPDEIENLLGDCAGPGTWFDHARQYLSTYGVDHYGVAATHAGAGTAPGLFAVLAQMAREAGVSLEGPAVEIGCAAGGVSHALAGLTGGPVLGVDMLVPVLRLFQTMLREGHATIPVRRAGTVFDATEVVLPDAWRACGSRVDGWCADGTALPLADASVGVALAMNVVDVVMSPLELLREMARVLRPGGVMLVCTPFDWTATSARMEQWLGGHSKRSLGGGNPARVLETILTPGASAASIAGVRLRASREGIPWNVRVHDRQTSAYTVHAVVATREA